MITAFKIYTIIGELLLLVVTYDPDRMIVKADRHVGRLGTVVVCLLFPFFWLPSLIGSFIFGVKEVK